MFHSVLFSDALTHGERNLHSLSLIAGSIFHQPITQDFVRPCGIRVPQSPKPEASQSPFSLLTEHENSPGFRMNPTDPNSVPEAAAYSSPPPSPGRSTSKIAKDQVKEVRVTESGWLVQAGVTPQSSPSFCNAVAINFEIYSLIDIQLESVDKDLTRVTSNTRHMVGIKQGLNIKPLRYTYWASCFKPESFTSTIRY